MKFKKIFVLLSLVFALFITSCEKVTEFPKAKDDVIKGTYDMLYMDNTKVKKNYEYSDSYFKKE